MNRHLKLIQRNYVGYTGQVGRWSFVDGVSVEPIPPVERIRIAANFQVVELDEDGNVIGSPSPAHTVVANHRTRLQLREPLARQTEDEKKDENVRVVMGSEERRVVLSREALENVASESGIAGLREIAAPWNVRSKSIPVLMQMIIDAQDAYVAAKRESLIKKGVPVEEIERLLAPVAEVPKLKSRTYVDPKVAEALTAAKTGDLAAAISVVEAERPE